MIDFFISIFKVKTTGFQPVSFSSSNFKKLTAKPICIIDAFSAASKVGGLPVLCEPRKPIYFALLDGKQRVAENVFGWNRSTVEVGISEFKTGMTCINDISLRHNPATKEPPKLL